MTNNSNAVGSRSLGGVVSPSPAEAAGRGPSAVECESCKRLLKYIEQLHAQIDDHADPFMGISREGCGCRACIDARRIAEMREWYNNHRKHKDAVVKAIGEMMRK